MKGYYASRLAREKARTGVVFSLPVIFGLIVMFIIPLMQSLYMAFSSVSIIQQEGFSFKFTGLENFKYAFTENAEYSKGFVTALLNMLKTVPVVLFMSIFCAMLINSEFRGRAIARVIFFLPIIYASSAMLNIDSGDVMQEAMQNSSYSTVSSASGLVGFRLAELVSQIGFPEEFVELIEGIVDSIYNVIQLSGVQIIIMLAALQSISPSLYEAAYVEGAGGWEKFWLITLPMSSSSIILCLIYSVIYSFTSFDNPVVSLTKQMMSDMKYGYSAAMSWAYFLIVFIILGLIYGIGNRFVFTYDKNK